MADADPMTLEAMHNFYTAVKRTISNPTVARPNPWVTASKLCARKRPRLFPVRDRVVCTYLGILHLDDARSDWQVFRYLVQNSEIQRALRSLERQVREAARDRVVIIEHSDLRLLDAAVWMHARTERIAPVDVAGE